MEVKGGERIQYTASLSKGWLDLLMFVPESVFYQIIDHVEQLGFSVYDCVFSSFHPSHRVSFFSFQETCNHLPFNATIIRVQIKFNWNGRHLTVTG